MLLLTFGESGFNLKFWIARPPLERLAASVATMPPGSQPPDQDVWFMRIGHIRRLSSGGARFAANTAANPFDYTGLAYSPTPLPEDQEVEGCYFRAYCGNWYTFWRPSGSPD